MEEAFDFLQQLELKPRKKILQNINRSKYQTDPKLFKKIDNEIWEFRTLYAGLQYRLLAFWDKSEKTKTLVFATHGFIKKTNKLNRKGSTVILMENFSPRIRRPKSGVGRKYSQNQSLLQFLIPALSFLSFFSSVSGLRSSDF